VLRVTINKQESGETWELEGKLSGEWVGELDRLWKERSPRPGVTTEIHLKAVSFVDPAGKQLLAEMHAHGAEIRGCGCMTRAVVEEIVRDQETRGINGSTKKILAMILFVSCLLGGRADLRAQGRPPLKVTGQDGATLGPQQEQATVAH
jgi:ABC-type transporter Mla MlaB component